MIKDIYVIMLELLKKLFVALQDSLKNIEQNLKDFNKK
jgi:hypothetical protein